MTMTVATGSRFHPFVTGGQLACGLEGICVYKNTLWVLTNVRVVWYNIFNQIQTVEAEITVYNAPTESPGS